MKTRIVILILFVFVFFSCNSEKEKEKYNTRQDTIVEANMALFGWTGGDTSITFRLKTNSITVKVQKQKKLNLKVANFQKFLDEYYGNELKWKNEIIVDLNGDGIANEKVITNITVEKDTCFVWKEVYNKEGEVFWGYRHFFSNMDDSWFFGTKEAYEKLKPYSMFYLGYESRQFDTLSLNDKLRSTYTHKLERIADFKNPHEYGDTEFIENYLKNFKGKCLKSYWLTFKEDLIYIFYEPENQFIAIDSEDTIPLRID